MGCYVTKIVPRQALKSTAFGQDDFFDERNDIHRVVTPLAWSSDAVDSPAGQNSPLDREPPHSTKFRPDREDNAHSLGIGNQGIAAQYFLDPKTHLPSRERPESKKELRKQS